MKLIKKDAQKICNNYDLGTVQKVEYLSEGWVNYNFMIKTEKGKYVVQFFGFKIDDWKMDKIRLQFKVLNYLKKKKFPYETPVPIKNKDGKHLSKLNGKPYWAYQFIEGTFHERYNPKQLKELIKALAIYHKTVKDLKPYRKEPFFRYPYFFDKYAELKKTKPENKIDRIMLKHVDFFIDTLKELERTNLDKGMTITQGDFNKSNLVFNKDKLVGIIDFDNARYAPKGRDLARSISKVRLKDKKKINQGNFVKIYRKFNKLLKNEERTILPLIIQDECISFWWMYAEMKKNRDKVYKILKETGENTRKLADKWKLSRNK